MSTPVFPEAFTLQRKLKRVLDNDLGVTDARAIHEAINLCEVVKLIDSYTTVDTTANPTPALPGFPCDGVWSAIQTGGHPDSL